LRLREFTYDDADFLVALLNDDDVPRNIGDRGVRTAADARWYLDEGPFTLYVAFGYGLWCVEERDGGRAIGIFRVRWSWPPPAPTPCGCTFPAA